MKDAAQPVAGTRSDLAALLSRVDRLERDCAAQSAIVTQALRTIRLQADVNLQFQAQIGTLAKQILATQEGVAIVERRQRAAAGLAGAGWAAVAAAVRGGDPERAYLHARSEFMKLAPDAFVPAEWDLQPQWLQILVTGSSSPAESPPANQHQAGER